MTTSNKNEVIESIAVDALAGVQGGAEDVPWWKDALHDVANAGVQVQNHFNEHPTDIPFGGHIEVGGALQPLPFPDAR
jgi:hypothetical protein